VFEIGCGRGGFAVWLAELPPRDRPAEIVAAIFPASRSRRRGA
jgi:hypothetical protein